MIVAVGVVVDCAVSMVMVMIVGGDGIADDTNRGATLIIQMTVMVVTMHSQRF